MAKQFKKSAVVEALNDLRNEAVELTRSPAGSTGEQLGRDLIAACDRVSSLINAQRSIAYARALGNLLVWINRVA